MGFRRIVLLSQWLYWPHLTIYYLRVVNIRWVLLTSVRYSLNLRWPYLLNLLLLLKHLILGLPKCSFDLLLLLHCHVTGHEYLLLFLGHIPRYFSFARLGRCNLSVTIGIDQCSRRRIFSLCILKAIQICCYMEGWLRTHLLLLMQRYLMIKLLK